MGGFHMYWIEHTRWEDTKIPPSFSSRHENDLGWIGSATSELNRTGTHISRPRSRYSVENGLHTLSFGQIFILVFDFWAGSLAATVSFSASHTPQHRVASRNGNSANAFKLCWEATSLYDRIFGLVRLSYVSRERINHRLLFATGFLFVWMLV